MQVKLCARACRRAQTRPSGSVSDAANPVTRDAPPETAVRRVLKLIDADETGARRGEEEEEAGNAEVAAGGRDLATTGRTRQVSGGGGRGGGGGGG